MTASVDNSDGSDWYYDHPDTSLFPSYGEWFEYLKQRGLKTYLNDHPYPVAARGAGGLQTSHEEVAFRWDGLSTWLSKGIDFWWFDRNWRFSIPPPFVNTSRTGADWEGLDNAAWGSYVYYETARVFNKMRKNNQPRPIALTKFAPWDWRDGFDAVGQQEHPAQHRFPVWWTGDGVPLLGSVESMVDAGVHGFKPFVHSDCGGDYRGSAGDLLRWTAHCSFGTILRFHGADHRLWSYNDDHIIDVGRQYIAARYRLLPSLIAGGHRATDTGFPLAARGDMYWPEHPDSKSNSQYIFLDDMLVAPIWETANNETTREVWIPPGTWQDCWNGSLISGPQNLSVTQPYERQPMWYRRDGGLLVLAGNSTLVSTVENQDWSALTLEAFPSAGGMVTKRELFEKGANDQEKTAITLSTDNQTTITLNIGAAPAPRAWIIRLHLHPLQEVSSMELNGETVIGTRIAPSTTTSFPLLDWSPAPLAGPIVEIQLSSSANPQQLVAWVQSK